jgi:hypothetical protein
MESLLSMFGPAVSPQLQEKLNSPSTTLLDVLAEETCMHGYRASFPLLVAFLAQHAAEILALALALDDIPSSTRAFTLLSSPGDLLGALVQRDLIAPAIARTLAGSPPAVVVNRLAVITGAIFAADAYLAVAHDVSPARFLPFIQHRSVYEMFVGFCGNDAKLRACQDCLGKDQFVPALLAAIAALPGAPLRPAQAAALFKLFPVVRATEAFEALATAPAALARLLAELPGAPTPVLNAQWAAVQAAVTPANIAVIAEQIPRIVGLIAPARDHYSAFQVAAIALAQALVGRDAARDALLDAALPRTLADVLRKFPRHTVAQNAVVAFVVAAIEEPPFAAPFLREIGAVGASAIKADPIEGRGFAWNLFRKVRETSTSAAEKVAGEDAWAAFDEIDAIVEKSYGGDPPQPQPPEMAGGGGNAQFMQLLLAMLSANRR